MADQSLEAVAQLGTSLASKLNLHSEGCRKSRQRLPKLVSLVNSTASTIRQIHDLIQQNDKVFTEACVKDINSLAAKCRAIYVRILTLIAKKTQTVSGDKDAKTLSAEQIEELCSEYCLVVCGGYLQIRSLRKWKRICGFQSMTDKELWSFIWDGYRSMLFSILHDMDVEDCLLAFS